MRDRFKILVITTIALYFSCSFNNDTTTGIGGGSDPIEASYRVTFETDFTTEFHANNYPDGTKFIKPLLVTHSNTTSIFLEGSFSFFGLKFYAEEGDSSTLVKEYTGGGDSETQQT